MKYWEIKRPFHNVNLHKKLINWILIVWWYLSLTGYKLTCIRMSDFGEITNIHLLQLKAKQRQILSSPSDIKYIRQECPISPSMTHLLCLSWISVTQLTFYTCICTLCLPTESSKQGKHRCIDRISHTITRQWGIPLLSIYSKYSHQSHILNLKWQTHSAVW